MCLVVWLAKEGEFDLKSISISKLSARCISIHQVRQDSLSSRARCPFQKDRLFEGRVVTTGRVEEDLGPCPS